MDHPVTAAIVADHPVVVEGMRSWITADPLRRIRITHVSPDLVGLGSGPGPSADVIILDLELRGQAVTKQIPRLVALGHRIVAFSVHSSPAAVMAVLDEGAHAYVAKYEGGDYLIGAVLAAAGPPRAPRSQVQAGRSDAQPSAPGLSAQERHALVLWFQGMPKASVGRRMSITENTVRQYINRARRKYALAGRPALSKDALLARAIEDQIISPCDVGLYTSQASSDRTPSAPLSIKSQA